MKKQASPNSNISVKKAVYPSPKMIVAIIVVLVVLVGAVVLAAPAISSFLQGLGNENKDYTQLNLVTGVSQTYKQEVDTYTFSYKLSSTDTSGLFYVTKNVETTRSYPAVPSSSYIDLGLEMKVSTVTSDLMVLLVKPQTV